MLSFIKNFKTRDKKSGLHDVVVKECVHHKVIADDDLAVVLEATPILYRMCDAVNEDLENYHRSIGKALQFPILYKAFFYMFAKGAEVSYLWNSTSADEFKHTPVNYKFEDLLEGRVGMQVDEEFNGEISAMSGIVYDAFVDVQDWLVANFERLVKSSLTVPDMIRDILRAIALVGVDHGMNRLGFK